jgi:hypothetical protein
LDARDDLLYIADRWPRLQAKLMTSNGGAQTGMPGAPSTAAPLELDLAVSDLMREIEDLARHYGRVLLDEVPTEHGCAGACHGALEHRCGGRFCTTVGVEPSVTPRCCPERVFPVTTSAMPALLVQVARRYGHWEGLELLAFMDAAFDYRERVAKTLARPEPARCIGPCQTPECAGWLYVSAGREAGTCRTCGVPFALDVHRVWVGQQMDARLMTAPEIWAGLKVMGTPAPLNTLKSWIRRRQLLGAQPMIGPQTEAESKERLYRLSDAQGLVTQRTARMVELATAREMAA